MSSSDLIEQIKADRDRCVMREHCWYTRRGELKSGMVFRDYEGDLVRLDRHVPGDGTRWYVDSWYNGHWSCDDFTIEPGDLRGGPLKEPSQ